MRRSSERVPERAATSQGQAACVPAILMTLPSIGSCCFTGTSNWIADRAPHATNTKHALSKKSYGFSRAPSHYKTYLNRECKTAKQ
eukprot:4346670-Pleurochrysis_carterae.AAC.1